MSEELGRLPRQEQQRPLGDGVRRQPPVSAECPGCGGTGVAIPAGLATLAGEL